MMTERDAKHTARLSKRTIDALKAAAQRFVVWDRDLKGFGVRVEPSGAKSYIVRYRVGGGRRGRLRQATLGRHGAVTTDQARVQARKALASVAHGEDPLSAKTAYREAMLLRELAEHFLKEHAEKKRKPSTAAFYRWTLEKYVLPTLGSRKAVDISEGEVSRLHLAMASTPYQANRVLTVFSSLYSWAGRRRFVPDGCNPVRRVERFPEEHRERYLTREELGRLGDALRVGETIGFPRATRGDKRAPRAEVRDILPPAAAAAIRLLLFTGARLSEILTLRWEHVDLERQALFLPDSKTGAKIVLLNAPALSVLTSLPRIDGNPFVIFGAHDGAHLSDLKRPWQAVCAHAGLSGVRLHDLRHTFASYGAAANMGLPVIGRLLGHSSTATTARYAHLADDPLRRASRSIASEISQRWAKRHHRAS